MSQNPRTVQVRRTNYAVIWRLWLLMFVSYGYFFTSDNPNATSRAALTLAIVERHELIIDRFAPFAGDKAFVNGSYYSDKAPGLSLMAVPVAWIAARILNPDAGIGPWVASENQLSRRFSLIVYLATLCTVSLPAAFAVAMAFRWSQSRGASDRASLFAAIALGLATPFWGWSTVLFGHATAGALLLLGFTTLATAMDRVRLGRPAPGWLALLAGLMLGSAFVVEFPAGPAVAIVGVCLATDALMKPDRWRLVRRALIPSAAGVVLPLAALLLYDYLAFGAPFTLSYENVQDFPGIQTGFFGVSWPDPKVALELLIGWYRGLLPLSPVLVLVPIAIVVAYRDPAWRLTSIVSVALFVWYLGLNAGYYYWDGGFSTGPRHLVPALPLLALPLARLWDAAGRFSRYAFMVLLTASVGLSLLCVSVDMFAPTYEHPHPLVDRLLPMAMAGDFARALIAKQPFGVDGPAALGPLFVVWTILGWPLARLVAVGTRAT